MPSPLSLSNFVNRLSRSLSTLQILPRRITSNKTLKNRKATKIQRTYRAYATRRKLEAEKLEKQAMHLFCKSKAVIAKAAKELDDAARDVDEDNINTIAHHLWHELSNKKRAKWIDEAKNKTMQQSKSAPIKPVVE
jgi:pyruvate formate-lyase activating enzyme-like uncharacterized protein